MILPDINVLINAHRPESPQHQIAYKSLKDLYSSLSPFALSSFVCAGFIRIVTNHRIFAQVSTLDEATAFIDYILNLNNCRLIEPGPNYWEILKKLLTNNRITGPNVSDAYLAAIAIENGCELLTFDSDFKKYTDLKIQKL